MTAIGLATINGPDVGHPPVLAANPERSQEGEACKLPSYFRALPTRVDFHVEGWSVQQILGGWRAFAEGRGFQPDTIRVTDTDWSIRAVPGRDSGALPAYRGVQRAAKATKSMQRVSVMRFMLGLASFALGLVALRLPKPEGLLALPLVLLSAYLVFRAVSDGLQDVREYDLLVLLYRSTGQEKSWERRPTSGTASLVVTLAAGHVKSSGQPGGYYGRILSASTDPEFTRLLRDFVQSLGAPDTPQAR